MCFVKVVVRMNQLGDWVGMSLFSLRVDFALGCWHTPIGLFEILGLYYFM